MDSMEILKNLTSDQAIRFGKLEKTFETDGWKLLVEWATTQSKLWRDRAALSESWDDNRIAVGKMAVFKEFITLEQSVTNEFEAQADANLETASQEMIDDVDSQS